MIDAEQYIRHLIALLQNRFKERLLYVGLQGSYLRGEATGSSDIDIMVVIDGLGIAELAAYRNIIESLPHTDKSCGFICGKSELANWNPLEICHLLHTTRDYFGSLSGLVPPYTRQDIRSFVKLSVNNMYHELCHRYIHGSAEDNAALLPGTYKGVFFILQNLYYLNHGRYIATKAEMLKNTSGKDHAILQRTLDLNNGIKYSFPDSFELLFDWCRETISAV